MDGVLIDSEPLWQRAEIELFATVGLQLTAEQAAETTGLRIDEVVALRHAQSPWLEPSPAELCARIVQRVAELVLQQGQPLPGAPAALALARASADRVGLATSSPRTLIQAVLARLELTHTFDAVATAEDERYGKPHPAVYLTLADRLAVPPSRCVAIEDSLHGLVAAKAARMRCVVVPDPRFAADPRFALADHQLRSLADLTPAHLRAG
jgi:HAD superfamily hydrolase (TIGR01509 family)